MVAPQRGSAERSGLGNTHCQPQLRMAPAMEADEAPRPIAVGVFSAD